MIARLKGSVTKLGVGQLVMDVNGVGYLIAVPKTVWDVLHDGREAVLWTSTYVREDRLDLYGFESPAGRMLFELLIAQSGIGPKTGLELCDVPRNLLLHAVQSKEPELLTQVKGIGRKTAEKLILELQTVVEKHPEIFTGDGSGPALATGFDQDAISALVSLGYDTASILAVLKTLPADLATTEERVAAALRRF